MPICKVPPSKPTAKLPAITPTRISTSATEIPSRMEIKLPMSAKPIQIEAINQMFWNIKTPSAWKESLAHAVFSRGAGEGKLHCLVPNLFASWLPIKNKLESKSSILIHCRSAAQSRHQTNDETTPCVGLRHSSFRSHLEPFAVHVMSSEVETSLNISVSRTAEIVRDSSTSVGMTEAAFHDNKDKRSDTRSAFASPSARPAARAERIRKHRWTSCCGRNLRPTSERFIRVQGKRRECERSRSLAVRFRRYRQDRQCSYRHGWLSRSARSRQRRRNCLRHCAPISRSWLCNRSRECPHRFRIARRTREESPRTHARADQCFHPHLGKMRLQENR